MTTGICQPAPTSPAASRIPSVNALDEEDAMEEAFKDDDGAPATPLGGVLALADRQDVHFKVICTFEQCTFEHNHDTKSKIRVIIMIRITIYKL